jgi:hypothetical protein
MHFGLVPQQPQPSGQGPQVTPPQTPFWQNPFGPQEIPHPPQLLGSDCVSVQLVPQNMNGGKQSTTLQRPNWQNPPGQTLPHTPQLLGSFCRSTHVVPLQQLRPTGQAQIAGWHLPATQLSPGTQR